MKTMDIELFKRDFEDPSIIYYWHGWVSIQAQEVMKPIMSMVLEWKSHSSEA